MRTLYTIGIAVLFVAFGRPVAAEEVPLGTWSGFALRLNGNNQNRQPASLVIKKVPDQHVIWRGGTGELISAVFTVQNQNNQREVSSIALTDGRLSFSVTQPDQDETVNCVLTLQPKDNTYVGECMARRITLTPPAPAPVKPADDKPSEAK